MKKAVRGSSSSLTPAPSSDRLEELDTIEAVGMKIYSDGRKNGLPSPITPANAAISGDGPRSSINVSPAFNSPSRKVSWCLVF